MQTSRVRIVATSHPCSVGRSRRALRGLAVATGRVPRCRERSFRWSLNPASEGDSPCGHGDLLRSCGADVGVFAVCVANRTNPAETVDEELEDYLMTVCRFTCARSASE